MTLWYDEVFEGTARYGVRVERTVFSGKSEYQTVEIFDTTLFGRCLTIDGIFMTSEKDEHYYHEMLVHPAMMTAASRKRVLVIGGGDGGTVREVCRYEDVERVLMVEIDRMVVEACREHLPTIGSSWDDPRLEVRFEDATRFVREAEEGPFDVVLLDGTDPVGPGVGLFDLGFFEACKKMLAPGGVFVMQSESPFLFEEAFLNVQRDLRRIYRRVHPFFGPVPLYASGNWSWTWASDEADPRRLDEEAAECIERHTRYWNREIHLAALALPNGLRRALGAEGEHT